MSKQVQRVVYLRRLRPEALVDKRLKVRRCDGVVLSQRVLSPAPVALLITATATPLRVINIIIIQSKSKNNPLTTASAPP